MDRVVQTRLSALYRFIFELDMNNFIRGNAGLMELHFKAEVFNYTAENFFTIVQVQPSSQLVN